MSQATWLRPAGNHVCAMLGHVSKYHSCNMCPWSKKQWSETNHVYVYAYLSNAQLETTLADSTAGSSCHEFETSLILDTLQKRNPLHEVLDQVFGALCTMTWMCHGAWSSRLTRTQQRTSFADVGPWKVTEHSLKANYCQRKCRNMHGSSKRAVIWCHFQ